MKKALTILLALLLTASLLCSASAEPKTYRIGVTIFQFNDNFMTLYRNELLDYFKSLETDEVAYDLTIVDAKSDMSEQTNSQAGEQKRIRGAAAVPRMLFGGKYHTPLAP